MSKANSYRVAIIGAGSITQYSHGPGFNRLPNAEVVALCDVNTARAQQLADQIGIPAVYGDYEKMLAEVKPDIAVVATPNVFHTPMTLAALEAGCHVLCEKPVALSYAAAEGMFAKAAAQNKVLSVGTHFRFTPPMVTAKAHAAAGFFGKIYAAAHRLAAAQRHPRLRQLVHQP